MAEALELGQLAEDDGVPEGQVGRGRVDAELDPQRPALGLGGLQPLAEAVARVELGHPRGEDPQLLLHGRLGRGHGDEPPGEEIDSKTKR